MVQIMIVLPEIAKAMGGMIAVALIWSSVQTLYQHQRKFDSIEADRQDAENWLSNDLKTANQENENCLGCGRIGLCERGQKGQNVPW
jgi:hypothetical protein